MRITKARMIREYPATVRERDLYQRYFWDHREAKNLFPDATCVERTRDGIRMSFYLYRTDAMHGGYIVIEQCDAVGDHVGVPVIEYWETWQATVCKWSYDGEYALACKRALGTLHGMLFDKRNAETVTESPMLATLNAGRVEHWDAES